MWKLAVLLFAAELPATIWDELRDSGFGKWRHASPQNIRRSGTSRSGDCHILYSMKAAAHKAYPVF